MSKLPKTIVYTDELNDEFSRAKITPRKIDGKYKYLHDNVFWDMTYFFWYRIFATPLAYIYDKVKLHHKFENKQILKKFKNVGYFLYGNHTQETADAFIPNMAVFPKRAFVVVHPNNVSMPVMGKLTPFMGALPIPGDMASSRNFMNALEKKILENRCVVIYPEAHIWPYYTGIRPFPATSFRYTVRFDAPAFCMTTTYHKRKRGDKPRAVTYIDGPFYRKPELSPKEQEQDLRDRIYDKMCERAKNNTYEYIKYVRGENNG